MSNRMLDNQIALKLLKNHSSYPFSDYNNDINQYTLANFFGYTL